MKNTNSTVFENQWVTWGSLFPEDGADLVVAQKAAQHASRKIKQQLGLRSEPFQFSASPSGLEFRATGIAGTLALREVTIEIVPKFVRRQERLKDWNMSTLFLLEALAGKHVISLLADLQEWESHSIVELIANAFADAAERGLRDQAIRIYRQTEESSVVLRGRLNIARQLRNYVQAPHLLECDVDELDDENPFNDVLRWAASILANLARGKDLKIRLEHIASALPGDPAKSQTYRHLRLIPPPQFQVWTDALELARLLASGMTLSSLGGHGSGYSLMFNMERAFERFVEVGLARALRQIGSGEMRSRRQEHTIYAEPSFLGGKSLYCIPDNVIRRHEQPLMVVDAKYKLLDVDLQDQSGGLVEAKPTSTDVYELLTGMLAHRCTLGLLVYPGSSERDEPAVRSWRINAYGTDVYIGLVPMQLINLHSRAELSEAFAKLADQITEFELMSNV